MININQLSTEDIGKWVVYTDPFTKKSERGKLKAWNDNTVFVVFKCNPNWADFKNYTAQGCDPKDVHFEIN